MQRALRGCLLICLVMASAGSAAEMIMTVWSTADSLMPAWGFYPLRQSYGGTKPLGKWAAWSAAGKQGRLTWVASFPAAGTYHAWVRQYGGYGSVTVFVDGQPMTGGKKGPGGGRYVWKHVGTAAITKGRHHVDLVVSSGMFDAILFTLNPNLQPAKGGLPQPVKDPVLRALRTYRDDSSLRKRAGGRGFVVGSVTAYEEVLYDWLPTTGSLIDRVQVWGTANQYINKTFAVRALVAAGGFRVSLKSLVGPGRAVVAADEIDVRVVHVRERTSHLFQSSRRRVLTPELLLRDDRTTLPPQGKQGVWGRGMRGSHSRSPESSVLANCAHFAEFAAGNVPG